MNSHLLSGKVRHGRHRPSRYELEHDVFYFALDLDELDVVARQSRLVGRNRRAPFAFRDEDHMPLPARDLAHDMRAHLAANGMHTAGARITLVTNLRVFGYVFNPASFYLCRDAAGNLAALVVEVHNTHGERHLYTLRPDSARADFRASMDKRFYVSPFIGPDGSYRVTVRDEPTGLSIGISERESGQALLSTSLVLRRRPLTTRSLLRLWAGNPLVTHKTIALIHWHALRLWLRRVPFHRHEPAGRVTAMQPGAHR